MFPVSVFDLEQSVGSFYFLKGRSSHTMNDRLVVGCGRAIELLQLSVDLPVIIYLMIINQCETLVLSLALMGEKFN